MLMGSMLLKYYRSYWNLWNAMKPTWSSDLGASGSVFAIHCSLVPGPFHWQWRWVDSNENASAWSSFGDNAESEAAFVALPVIREVVDCSGSAGAAAVAAWSLLCMVAASLGRARETKAHRGKRP